MLLSIAGIPSEGYATVYEPIFKALERDTRLLQLYVLNNNSAALKNSVNGADTVQVRNSLAPACSALPGLCTWSLQIYCKQPALPLLCQCEAPSEKSSGNFGLRAVRAGSKSHYAFLLDMCQMQQ